MCVCATIKTVLLQLKAGQFGELENKLGEELLFRQQNGISRDTETMSKWAYKEGQKLYNNDMNKYSKYKNFRGSRKWIDMCIIRREWFKQHESSEKKITKQDFIDAVVPWVGNAREFIIDNDYVANDGYAYMECFDNVDEVPLVLKPEARKQVNYNYIYMYIVMHRIII